MKSAIVADYAVKSATTADSQDSIGDSRRFVSKAKNTLVKPREAWIPMFSIFSQASLIFKLPLNLTALFLGMVTVYYQRFPLYPFLFGSNVALGTYLSDQNIGVATTAIRL
uniref:Uncharacterized protein n=1 Tax=Romanomermis culicivorax TaxID=13658 RepID=A0A915I710_ROMCU